MRADVKDTQPVVDRVSKAEQMIAVGNYEGALEQLRAAQAEAPTNKYIPALVERTIALLYPSTLRRRQEGVPAAVAEDELTRHVRRLTSVAKDLYERGSYEIAFQSLLKAFQLAPTSPYVLECQKILSPALELLRKQGTLSGVQVPAGRPRSVSAESETADWRRLITKAPQKEREPRRDPQEERIQALRKRKETERRERELAMWREAAKPPRFLQKAGAEPPADPQPS